MRLLSLSLEQFRSYQSLELDLSGSALHVFVGPNGGGKTNILEAVALLSLLHSPLQREEDDLRLWETEFFRIQGRARSDKGEDIELTVVNQNAPRRRKVWFRNGVKKMSGELVGELPTVLFLPSDLALFTGPPQDRRRFLDRILCQLSPDYARALAEYQRILKQRNALLSRMATGNSCGDELTVWDAALAQEGSAIVLARLELLETFQLTLPHELQTFGESFDDVRLMYERKGEARERGELAEELRTLLTEHRDRDILLEATTVGPHRDDWKILMDGRELSSFASRGQQRACVLALLFLQASYMELRRGEKPVILLDDVLSEFDQIHRGGVLEALKDHQVLLTALEPPAGLERARVWHVDELKRGGGPSAAGEHRRPPARAHRQRHRASERL